jgi:homoserine kinase
LSKVVSVRIPGSTSNLGSGFDTLGLALQVYNRVRVSSAGAKGVRLVACDPSGDWTRAQEMVRETVRLFFKILGQPSPGLEVELGGEVPIGRGLGASATARVGVLVALNELAKARLDRAQLLDLATRLEGHPDNASPALYGGFTVSGPIGDGIRCVRFPVKTRAAFVTLIPSFQIQTEAARQLMPGNYSKRDAAHSLNRAALITAAFAKGDLSLLQGVFDDRFHQPYREQLIPALSRVLRAGEKAGAIGGWLSGSGSAVICLARENTDEVGAAMRRQLPGSEVRLLSADDIGATLV